MNFSMTRSVKRHIAQLLVGNAVFHRKSWILEYIKKRLFVGVTQTRPISTRLSNQKYA